MTASTASTCEITFGTLMSRPPVMCEPTGFTHSATRRAKYEYTSTTSIDDGPLLFGQIKIWGEVIEHEVGYRSQFGRIVSLDYGDRKLLEKFRKIYRVNQMSA